MTAITTATTAARAVNRLSALKSAELRQLAFLTGLSVSGTKASLVESLPSALAVPLLDDGFSSGSEALGKHVRIQAPDRSGHRILSIDMGIRNLAYCVIDVPDLGILEQTRRQDLMFKHGYLGDGEDTKESGKRKVKSKQKGKTDKDEVVSERVSLEGLDGLAGREYQQRVLRNLTVTAWERIAVAAAAPSTTPVTRPSSSLPPSPSLSTGATRTATISPESFTPSTLARLATDLVTKTFLAHKPTQILIERQRFRSGGAAAVQEWTLRVNMFESMLFAVLEALRGVWVMQQRNHEQEIGGEDAHGLVEETQCVMTETEGKAYPEEADTQHVLNTLSIFPHVLSVSPKRVANFWIDDSDNLDSNNATADITSSEEADTATEKSSAGKTTATATATRSVNKSSSKSKIEKESKIALAESWLRDGVLRCVDTAAETSAAFLAKRAGGDRVRRTTKRGPKTSGDAGEDCGVLDDMHSSGKGEGKQKLTELGKLDDLADCALQGAAWVVWEVNRRVIHKALEVHEEANVEREEVE